MQKVKQQSDDEKKKDAFWWGGKKMKNTATETKEGEKGKKYVTRSWNLECDGNNKRQNFPIIVITAGWKEWRMNSFRIVRVVIFDEA